MRKALLATALCMLLSGVFAFSSYGTSAPVTDKDRGPSLSVSKQQLSEVWQIADGSAKALTRSVKGHKESAGTEFNLQIELMQNGQIYLNWDDIDGALGYNVYHCAYPAPTLGEAPWDFWETDSSEYLFDPTETDYLNLGFFYVTAITETSPPPDNFVYIPGGTFTMGDTRGGGESWELPTHNVTLNSFYMGKYEVTQAEYVAVMGFNPASGYGVGANYPVYYVSWYSALKYCNLRSMNEGLTPVYSISGSTNPAAWGEVPFSDNATWNAAICNWTANGYRLPTEAEWEYAVRGATNDPDYLYSGSDDLSAVGWHTGNNTPYGSKPVGTKMPNTLGLYDMSGNVWEWCWNWHDDYSSSPSNNPTGPNSGSVRMLRGGSWNNDVHYCRVAYRTSNMPSSRVFYFGFRLCRSGL